MGVRKQVVYLPSFIPTIVTLEFVDNSMQVTLECTTLKVILDVYKK